MKVCYNLMIAGISMRWIFDEPLKLDERYEFYCCAFDGDADVIYEIKKGTYPRNETEKTVLFQSDQYRILEDDRYRYRIFVYKKYPVLQEVTLIRKKDDGKHWCLYLPEAYWSEFHYAKNWSYYMAFEEMFAENERMLLHASFVQTKEGAILFTGPSGIGKSTQAALWEQYQDAEVINGDRTLLYEQDGRMIAAGSPCAGTSGIYKNKQTALLAIVVLEQGLTNQIERLRGNACLLPLIMESNFPYMDRKMREFQLDLYCRLEKQIPVYHYRCRKDKSAVDCLDQILSTIGG